MAAKRALITGITGMVGSHLAEFLLEHTDWDVVGMCRWRSPLDNLSGIAGRINAGDRASLLYGDLRDTLSIQLSRRRSILVGSSVRACGPIPINCLPLSTR